MSADVGHWLISKRFNFRDLILCSYYSPQMDLSLTLVEVKDAPLEAFDVEDASHSVVGGSPLNAIDRFHARQASQRPRAASIQSSIISHDTELESFIMQDDPLESSSCLPTPVPTKDESITTPTSSSTSKRDGSVVEEMDYTYPKSPISYRRASIFTPLEHVHL